MTETDPENRLIGYARVSTYGQTLDIQITQLHAEGCAKIYQEKLSPDTVAGEECIDPPINTPAAQLRFPRNRVR